MSSFARPSTMDAENALRAAGGKPAAVDHRMVTRRAALGDRGTNVRAPTAAPPAVAAAVPKPALPAAAGHFGAAAAAGPGLASAAYAPAAAGVAAMDMSDAYFAREIPAGVRDIDAEDAHDPATVSEYAAEIHSHQRAEELTKSPRHGYMSHQTDINEKMRAILLDWLAEVHVKFKLMPETMYLTQLLIDRFLEKKIVVRSKLQLVGVTAMLIASKYEEIYAPEVRDFVYITDKAYTREQILAMEASMLNTLDFRVSAPTVYVFLNRYLKVAQADTRLTQLSTFIVERMLQEYRMLHHLPSKIAASAVNMALRTLRGAGAWDATMAFHASYDEAALRPCVIEMQDIMAASVGSSLQAVRKKYAMPKFGEVTAIPIAPLA